MKPIFIFLMLPFFAHTQSLSHDLDSILQKNFPPDRPGCALLVVKNDRVIFKKAVGLADLEKRTPLTPKSNFRLASVSKQFTAMAILLLEKRGKLTFDDPLTKFFPAFAPVGKTVKIRHLLTHTSGLLDYENLMPDTLSHQLSDADVLRMLTPVDRLYFQPGSAFRYSNGGYCLLAQIVEKVSGNTFANFLKDNIFQPLGMKNTCVFEQGKRIKNRAFGYAKDELGNAVFSDQSLTSATQGDGGVYASLNDYLKWHRALESDYFLDLKQSLKAVNASLPGGEGKYGAGWFFAELPENQVEMFHSGTTCGFSNDVVRAPGFLHESYYRYRDEKGILVVFFSNMADNHEAFAPIFERLKKDGLVQLDYQTWHRMTN